MICRMAPISDGGSKRICHHQLVAPVAPCQARLFSAEKRSPSIAPAGAKPGAELDAVAVALGSETLAAAALLTEPKNAAPQTQLTQMA